jgi:hypothetical protein
MPPIAVRVSCLQHAYLALCAATSASAGSAAYRWRARMCLRRQLRGALVVLSPGLRLCVCKRDGFALRKGRRGAKKVAVAFRQRQAWYSAACALAAMRPRLTRPLQRPGGTRPGRHNRSPYKIEHQRVGLCKCHAEQNIARRRLHTWRKKQAARRDRIVSCSPPQAGDR